jgi:hypothetical protein
MDGKAPTPAANHLFTVDENQTKVDEKKAQFFHAYVAKTFTRNGLNPHCTKLPRIASCDPEHPKKSACKLGHLCMLLPPN